tara:strand:- start:4875 stop:6089 length:1215 start_codon:yes stop_codon:yes gene_type:complete
MKIVVLKFGGTSVGSTQRIKNVAKIVSNYIKKKIKIIIVSSAMGGFTNKLINKSLLVSDKFDKSEYDVLLSAGEQISCSLLAGRLRHIGLKSKSFMSWQVPIISNTEYSNAKILNIPKTNIIRYLKQGGIPVIAGFQGINNENRITTLGRGASDYSAIMIAKYFKASKCVIYTDVSGVMTTDPKIFKKAKKIKVISYEEMLEMSSLGSRVMQSNSVQDARLNRINIEVKSSFKKNKGTLITKKKNIGKSKVIRGISFTKNDAKITLASVVDKPGIAASVFKPLSNNNINVDMVVQTISVDGKTTDITFTIKQEDLKKTKKLLEINKKINYKKLLVDGNVSKVSIVGVGMVTTPGITYRMFKAISKRKINILAISTSEIKISVLIHKKRMRSAVTALHNEFKLGN